MKLADFAFVNGLSVGILGRRLGIKNRSTLHRYLNGERVPEWKTMCRIMELTNDSVGPRDFLSPEPPACAVVQEREDGSTRWVFPWSRSIDDADHDALDEQEPSEPLARALLILGSRANSVSDDRYLLDGSQTDIRGLVRAANRMLSQAGQQVILYPGVKDHDE